MEKERYRIIRKLAEGGSGVTSLVWDEHLSRQWVMKEITLQGEGGQTAEGQYDADQAEGQCQAVQAEIRALTAVRMDGIPFLADAWREENKVYLIMEYLEGMTLEQRIATQGAMAETEVVRIGVQLAVLLQYLHEGLLRSFMVTSRLPTSSAAKIRQIRRHCLISVRHLCRAGNMTAADPEAAIIRPAMRHPN